MSPALAIAAIAPKAATTAAFSGGADGASGFGQALDLVTGSSQNAHPAPALGGGLTPFSVAKTSLQKGAAETATGVTGTGAAAHGFSPLAPTAAALQKQAAAATVSATASGSAATGATTTALQKQLAKLTGAAPTSAPVSGAAAQTASTLAGLQSVVQNTPAAVSTSTAMGLNDILQQATGATAGSAGSGQARLANLTQQLNRLETRTTGVDPTAPPQGWTEPQVFANARSALNQLLGGGSTTIAQPGNPLAMAGVATVPGQTAAGAAAATPAAQTGQTAQQAQSSAIAQAAQAAQTTETVAPQLDPHPLQSAASAAAAPAPFAAATPTGSVSVSPKARTAPTTGLSAPTPAPQSPATPLVTALKEKVGDHADALAAATPDLAQASADQAADTAKTSESPVNPTAAADAQAQTQAANTQAATALAQDPTHALPQATAYLAAQMVKRLDGKATQFDMELHPADMGRVDVQMKIGQDGRLNAQLSFDNPAAAAEFRSRSGELRQSLEQAGFQLTDDSLSFKERSPQDFGQGASQGFDQGSGASGQSGSRARAFRDSEITAQTADAVQPTPGRSVLGLDMRV
jgi:flagellar hook-length control protein FliK